MHHARSDEEIARALTSTSSARFSERLIGYALAACGLLSVLTTVGIVAVLIEEALQFFGDVSAVDFLFGTTWTALFANGSFGVLPLVSATVLIAALSMVVAIPVGLLVAIYLSEYASPRVRAVVKPVMELLAGVPTIVFGYFALTFITPSILRKVVPGTEVFNVMAAAIAVGIMVVPLVASLSEDALAAVPRALREGGYGMGATKMEVATQVVVPAALSGIVASIVLAISRAFGETMIVAIAAGSKAQIADDPFESAQTMTGFMVQAFSGDVETGSTVYKSLFAVGLLLFLITLVLNLISNRIVARFREAYD
ncbi:MAG: phosphate ABC transporter permease subunit PstC [Thermomicrobiales bacterium]|nr:phosphate ABC transporter permease subunit PstC [Thermomicrobiales bacterium]